MSDENQKHRDIKATDPIPARRGLASIAQLTTADRMREVAINAIAIEEGCSREEAAARLDATPPLEASESPEAVAARRIDAEHRRVERAVLELRMAVRPELVPDLVRTRFLRTEATTHAGAWLRSDKRVLALIGDVGVGKTVAACLVAAHFVRRRKSVAYLREPALVRLWHSPTLANQAQVERLREVDLLIVDELGTTLSRDGERSRDALFGMVDDRIGTEGRMVIIGNLTEPKLSTAYGVRFVDRLREVGTIATVNGESLRGRGGQGGPGAARG